LRKHARAEVTKVVDEKMLLLLLSGNGLTYIERSLFDDRLIIIKKPFSKQVRLLNA